MMANSFGYEVMIPLKEQKLPARDLNFGGESLTQEEALQLIEEGHDLSTLDPFESEVWSNEVHVNNDKVHEEVQLDFAGAMISYTGLLRFNALTKSENVEYRTVLMHNELHTILLRKNLLKKLGYKIPSIDYVRNLKLTFETVEQKKKFVNETIHQNTQRASTRWLVNDDDKENDNLVIHLQDVALMTPSQTDHYNVALGVPVGNPPRPLEDRVLRALALPYSLVHLLESVNKFRWHMGRVDNDHVFLEHFAYGLLNTGLEDAKWVLKRMARLTTEDFVDIVVKAYFPPGVDMLVYQKLLSRRNSLMKTFDMNVEDLPVNPEENHGQVLVNGKLMVEDYEGYTTRFAHGDTESPFKDFEYFVFNKLQKAGIDELMTRVNAQLSAFDPTDARLEFHRNQFETGLNHFVNTGELLEFGVGYWTSPVLDGTLIMSRDIVVGNYFGTDNLVQMADTFGYAVSAGVHIGFENIPDLLGVHARATGSFMRTFSHLRPVLSLKKTFEEPYRNMIVPLIKKDLKEGLDRLATLPDNEERTQEQQDLIQSIFETIDESLNVGESLVITDKIVPSVSGGAGMLFGETYVSFGMNAKKDFISRMQIYRKEESTIQVYVDKGRSFEFNFKLGARNLIPILSVHGRRATGNYSTKLYHLDISPDSESLTSSAKALYDVLENKSTEYISEIAEKYEFDGTFQDKSFRLRLLMFFDKNMTNNSDILFKDPRDRQYRFLDIKHTSIGGVNYQAFATDIVNYFISLHFEGFQSRLNNEEDKNPAQTVHGKAKTKSAQFEGRVPMDNGVIEHPFIRLTTRYEGWSLKEGWSLFGGRLGNFIENINRDFKRQLFTDEMLQGLDGLKLYEISSHMNIYSEGVIKLMTMRGSDFRVQGSECRQAPSNPQEDCRSLKKFNRCQQIATIKVDGVTKKVKGPEYIACMMEFLVLYNEDTRAHEIIKLLGEENVFVHGTINGFRQNSEILNEPVRSHTIGNINGGRYWNGPVTMLLEKIGIQSGQFYGSWLRRLQ